MKPYMPQSKSDIHETPDQVFDIIGISKELMFDPCPVNPEFDGLKIKWKQTNFVNPPYSLLSQFVEKAHNETMNNNVSYLLLPSKTDQLWFHKYIIPRIKDVIWLQGRLKFKGHKSHATIPHFIIRFEANIMEC